MFVRVDNNIVNINKYRKIELRGSSILLHYDTNGEGPSYSKVKFDSKEIAIKNFDFISDAISRCIRLVVLKGAIDAD